MKRKTTQIAIMVMIFAVTAIAFQSCKSKKDAAKAPEDEVLVEVYCSGPEYFSNNEYFRANQVGESSDMAVSKKKALSNAKADLAGFISTKLKAVFDNYVKDVELNNTAELEERYEGLSREVVNQELQGIKVMCEKVTKTTKGTYKTYMAIELSGEEILSNMNNRLSKDAKLKIDYDYEKFKNTFDEEMDKMENESR